VVLDASVLVVGDEEEGIVPIGVRAEDIIDLYDERFAGVDGKVRMLAVGIGAGGHIVVIGRFDKDIFGQVAFGRIVNKL
jgi:hypothetical protein